ncbi:G-D-S-L family lipolytic protein [Aphanothece hegewaldii CCALA 016]|uniref:G-D-S-L family lipolytic protein n=1 Tax=Aphanothece hegewaldii CCALA 016 TaxID=2107694 RepID=A0A2T1LRZ4_9CHRO|nr:GDSL-type esterase/lipase family protein [Aphanothece hegewaldii]PSF32095.1 G-D-S-L family lipolytic protein [Aphanothece hegewaldii CCALA 016]
MIGKTKFFLKLSIFLNLIFFIGFSLWLLKKVNPSFFKIINSTEQNQVQNHTRPIYKTPYYNSKVEEFKNLPMTKEDVILLGDSLTDLGEWQELLQNVNVKNRGISGDTTDGVLNRLDQIIAGQPKKIFILIGANDFWWHKRSIADVLQNYKLTLDTLKQQAPNTKVYVQSLLPVNNTNFDVALDNSTLSEFNQQLEQLVKNYPYQYINLYPHFLNKENQLSLQYTTDGVHLSVPGYIVWKNQIEKYINE